MVASNHSLRGYSEFYRLRRKITYIFLDWLLTTEDFYSMFTSIT